jgi:hypothetical protein
MATTNAILENDVQSTKAIDRDREKWADKTRDNSVDKTVETEPKLRSWMIIAAGAVVPLGLACAAAVATYVTVHERVAVTAWIAVAVVGTASVVSAGVAARRRVMTLARDNQTAKESGRQVSRTNDASRTEAG